MPDPVSSSPSSPGGQNRTVHYVGLAVLTIAIIVGLVFIL